MPQTSRRRWALDISPETSRGGSVETGARRRYVLTVSDGEITAGGTSVDVTVTPDAMTIEDFYAGAERRANRNGSRRRRGCHKTVAAPPRVPLTETGRGAAAGATDRNGSRRRRGCH